MKKPKGVGLDAPPQRGTPSSPIMMDSKRNDDELVAISHKVPAHLVRTLKLLAIDTDKEQRELVAEALVLLSEKYGSS